MFDHLSNMIQEKDILRKFFSDRKLPYDMDNPHTTLYSSSYRICNTIHCLNEYIRIDLEHLQKKIDKYKEDILGLIRYIKDKMQEMYLDQFIYLSSHTDMTREQFLDLLDSGMARSFSVDEARRISNMFLHQLHNGDLLSFDTQTLHLIKDENIIKVLPQDNWRNFNTVIPMYLVSKYKKKDLNGLTNTSIFMDHDYIPGKIHSFQHESSLDSSIPKSLQNRGDFTDEELSIVDVESIILHDKYMGYKTLIQ